MVRGQRNEMVKDPGFARSVPLELLDQLISFLRERRFVHLRGHEASWCGYGVWVSAQVLALSLPFAVDLLSERQRPVKRRGVVVYQLRIRHVLTYFIHHAGDLRDIGFFRFDPKEVRAMFQAGYAVEHHAIKPCVLAECVQAVIQSKRFNEVALLVNDDVVFCQLREIVHGR